MVIVGRRAVGAPEPDPAARIELMDGVCVGQAACANPRLSAIATAVRNAGHTVVRQGPAKNRRATTEVWYQAGKKGIAEGLATGPLSAWVAAGAIKEWKWGGDFDVLIVVGSAN